MGEARAPAGSARSRTGGRGRDIPDCPGGLTGRDCLQTARILAYTSPGRSHLFPLTPILDELHGRGHEIVLRTLASQVALMQTRGFDAAPIDASIEALAAEPVTVVATLPAGDPAAMRVPANAHVERFISHRAVLERAACAIIHGGMGSTQKALSYGVPVCAVPFGRDQLEVARRVEVARAGTRLLARRLRADRLRAKVREAMACTEGARRIAAAYAATGGARAAADAFEARLLRPPNSPADIP